MTLVAEAWGVPSSKRRGQKTESETAIKLVASKTKSHNGTRSLPWPLSPLHTSGRVRALGAVSGHHRYTIIHPYTAIMIARIWSIR